MQWLGQRLVSLVVGGFALMGFCLVPLGERTALGHLVALGRTDAARQLGQGLAGAARAVAGQLEAATDGAARPPESPKAGPVPGAPALPRPGSPHRSPKAHRSPEARRSPEAQRAPAQALAAPLERAASAPPLAHPMVNEASTSLTDAAEALESPAAVCSAPPAS